jgi:hypothetical protein
VTTVLVPVVYISVLGIDPPRLPSGFLWLVGIGVGLVWANTTALSQAADGAVMGRRSVWYLWVWGGTFLLTQFLALVGSRGLASVGISTIYLSMGLAIGTNGNLLYRRSQVAKGRPDAPLGPVVGRSTAVATAGAPGATAAYPVSRQQPAQQTACPSCGQSVPPGGEFCVACGRAIG